LLFQKRGRIINFKRGDYLKKIYIFCFISILLSFLGFYLIENVFSISPDVWSGNGNPGILIIMLFSPVFVLSYFFICKLTREILANTIVKKKIVILIFTVISCALLILPIINYIDELVIALDGTPADPESKIYRFGWFNQYTNGIYFNVYTFLLSHLLAVIIGILSTIRIKR
jgi:hypothetical protein